MTLKFHWGVTVDSEQPVGGVLNIGSIAWELIDNEICLTCETIAQEAAEAEDFEEAELDFIECDPSHTKLIGDWFLDEEFRQYVPDKTGEFAAIVNESTVQVVWSTVTARCALCSPCYPGQGDLDTPGDFLAYTLPKEMLI